MHLRAGQQPDVAEVDAVDGRAIGGRGGRDARRRLRIHAQGDRPGRRAVVEDAEHDPHVARSAAGGPARPRGRIELQVQAQRVGQAVVGEEAFDRAERLQIDFRAQPSVPADVQVVGVVAETGLDGPLSLSAAKRTGSHDSQPRSVPLESTPPIAGAKRANRAVPAPPRTARAISGETGDAVGRGRHRLRQLGKRPDGVLLQ